MRTLALSLCVCLLIAPSVVAQNFSVAPGTPDTFGGTPPADDILGPGFPPFPVVVGGTAANVDGLSYNHLGLTPFDKMYDYIDFSVDAFAVGTPGSAVFMQFGLGEAQTDVFRSPLTGTNFLLHDGDGSSPSILGPLGLDEGVSFTTSARGVDGYENQPTGPPTLPGDVYWSVDAPSLGAAPFTGFSAADVFVGTVGTYATVPIVYASEAALGLSTGDELDALTVFDHGAFGIFDPGDAVLFSLAPGSPSLGTFGVTPGDVLLSGAGGFAGIYVPHFALGLTASDNLNALDVVPEPGSFVMFLSLGVLTSRRRRQRGRRKTG